MELLKCTKVAKCQWNQWAPSGLQLLTFCCNIDLFPLFSHFSSSIFAFCSYQSCGTGKDGTVHNKEGFNHAGKTFGIHTGGRGKKL